MTMKRLMVCSDGTWNKRGAQKPTNVEKMAQAIRPVTEDGIQQVVFYDLGVGTGNGLDRFLGGVFGWGLSKNVADAYRFLVDNYAPGDQIYLFGFSRGAFTSRSTAGLIRKCHLLKKEHAQRFPEAYEIYREHEGGPDSERAESFRDAYSTPGVRVTCLGVWDTVGSLGIPGHVSRTSLGRWLNRDYAFHDVKISSTVVGAGYHALAIDEQRGAFAPAIWWREANPDQPLEQAWFPGAHSDVGGGNQTRTEAKADGSLADVAFEWMVSKAKVHGLEFDANYLATRIHADPLAPIHPSRRGFYNVLRSYKRRLLALPDDRELQELIARRRRESTGADPLSKPTILEAPQSIDESARTRWSGDGTYRPENLRAHIEEED